MLWANTAGARGRTMVESCHSTSSRMTVSGPKCTLRVSYLGRSASARRPMSQPRSLLSATRAAHLVPRLGEDLARRDHWDEELSMRLRPALIQSGGAQRTCGLRSFKDRPCHSWSTVRTTAAFGGFTRREAANEGAILAGLWCEERERG